MDTSSVLHGVILFRRGGDLGVQEFYTGTHPAWTTDKRNAKLLEEEYATSMARGLKFLEPSFAYDTIAA